MSENSIENILIIDNEKKSMNFVYPCAQVLTIIIYIKVDLKENDGKPDTL